MPNFNAKITISLIKDLLEYTHSTGKGVEHFVAQLESSAEANPTAKGIYKWLDRNPHYKLRYEQFRALGLSRIKFKMIDEVTQIDKLNAEEVKLLTSKIICVKQMSSCIGVIPEEDEEVEIKIPKYKGK